MAKRGSGGQPPEQPAGPAVDLYGRASLDPSENVYKLVSANERRQDDLRESEARHIREKVADAQTHQREISRCIEEMAALRADYEDKLRIKEGTRIDAVRSVDVQASQQQAADAETRAATLAKTVTDSAEALRNQVIQSQIAATAYVNTSLEPLKKDVAELRQVQFEQAGSKLGVAEGRDTAADFAAALAPMVAEIKKLSDAGERGTGHKEGVSLSTKVLVTAISVGSVLLSIVVTVVALATR